LSDEINIENSEKNVVFSFLFELSPVRNYNILPHIGAVMHQEMHQKQTGQ
jgi:hypothetical protein